MATDPTAPAKDSAEGSCETIDRELERAENPRKSLSPRGPTPGDEAVTGTPGTGEDICPDCPSRDISRSLRPSSARLFRAHRP
jgi:hypothetical protein